MKALKTVVTGSLLLFAASSFAADFSGTWCRPQHSGQPDDIIWVQPSGEIYSVSLSEGWNASKYSRGIASAAGNTLAATLKAEKSGKIIHAVMTISGNNLSYRSYRDNQTTHYWRGEYKRCHKP